jgi:hypothetical protein
VDGVFGLLGVYNNTVNADVDDSVQHKENILKTLNNDEVDVAQA